jgi:SAM-dependent methyltransferase
MLVLGYAIKDSLRPRLPFTTLNTVTKILTKDAKTVLDLGCGGGGPMAVLKKQREVTAIGADIFLPSLVQCRDHGTHDDLVQCDGRHLPFRPKSFDVVLAMEILEHMDQEQGLLLLRSMEEAARLQVIITTPVGRHPQHEYDGNPWQEHKHIWEPQAMRRLGYTVYGHGIRNLGGMSGVQSPLPHLIRPLVDVAWVCAGPIARVKPEWGGNMVAVKNL